MLTLAGHLSVVHAEPEEVMAFAGVSDPSLFAESIADLESIGACLRLARATWLLSIKPERFPEYNDDMRTVMAAAFDPKFNCDTDTI